MATGQSQPVQVFITRGATSANTAKLTLTATSESDPTKTAKVVYALSGARGTWRLMAELQVSPSSRGQGAWLPAPAGSPHPSLVR
jgi:hypothetical protein